MPGNSVMTWKTFHCDTFVFVSFGIYYLIRKYLWNHILWCTAYQTLPGCTYKELSWHYKSIMKMAYEVEWISKHTKTKACIPSTVISDVNTQLLIEKQSAALSLAMKKNSGQRPTYQVCLLQARSLTELNIECWSSRSANAPSVA